MASNQRGRADSSVAVHSETLERLNETKPYESLSHNDFIDLLLDMYESSNPQALPAQVQ